MGSTSTIRGFMWIYIVTADSWLPDLYYLYRASLYIYTPVILFYRTVISLTVSNPLFYQDRSDTRRLPGLLLYRYPMFLFACTPTQVCSPRVLRHVSLQAAPDRYLVNVSTAFIFSSLDHLGSYDSYQHESTMKL